MLRTIAFAIAAGVAIGLPVVLLLNALDPAAWITQTTYFVVVAAVGLATAHYDAHHGHGVLRTRSPHAHG